MRISSWKIFKQPIINSSKSKTKERAILQLLSQQGNSSAKAVITSITMVKKMLISQLRYFFSNINLLMLLNFENILCF